MNLINLLSKTDFKVALDCPTKLYYRKKNYASVKDGNTYMEYLAEGGYAVAKMATLYFPTGIRIDNYSGVEKAIKETQELIKQEECILFEAAFIAGRKLAVVDILHKKGNQIELIEVKSKGHDDNESISKIWAEEIMDVAFQKQVLQEAFPDYEISCYIMAPDKNKATEIEGLNALFKLNNYEQKNGFEFFDIAYSGNASMIQEDYLLTKVDINQEVLKCGATINQLVAKFEAAIHPSIEKIPTKLSKNCFNCEYKDSGKKECWEHKHIPTHSIEELYFIGVLGGRNKPAANQMIESNTLSLFDIPPDVLSGKRGERQHIQIQHTREQNEWIAPNLKSELNALEYPLHFIDFETATSALPFHKGMYPYEMSAFQWSCHTIPHPGAEPIHSEWINFSPEFPSFKFAESLKAQIGDTGTPFMWATHENTTLRNIYYQAERYQYENQELLDWLKRIVKMDNKDEGRFIDMNKVCIESYFHPFMKGRTSIKVTLPAVLMANKSQRTVNWLKHFGPGIDLYATNAEGQIIDPYKQLPPMDFPELTETVNEGTAAMRAYEDMLFGKAQGNLEMQNAYKKALLNYCKLDTLAMVIIWEHWHKS